MHLNAKPIIFVLSAHKHSKMNEIVSIKNWQIGDTYQVLADIHQEDVNIVIQNRDVSSLSAIVRILIAADFQFQSSGDVDFILSELRLKLADGAFEDLLADVEVLLTNFKSVSEAQSFRLTLATVASDMCRKFHTDLNDIRMLCTYSGPGTLWLKEENINRKALNASGSDNHDIVLDTSQVQQAGTGAVVLLKGAIYPGEGTRAAVHRSPSIEEYSKKRLLLRIDTNGFLNFI